MNKWKPVKIGWFRWALRRTGYRNSDGHDYVYYRDCEYRVRRWWALKAAQKFADYMNWSGGRLP